MKSHLWSSGAEKIEECSCSKISSVDVFYSVLGTFDSHLASTNGVVVDFLHEAAGKITCSLVLYNASQCGDSALKLYFYFISSLDPRTC